jgi:hypothetical protein
MSHHIDYGTRNEDIVRAGRLMFQKHCLERDAVKALKDVMGLAHLPNGSETIRLATEALDHAAVALEGSILDFASTIQAGFLLDRAETLREMNAQSKLLPLHLHESA